MLDRQPVAVALPHVGHHVLRALVQADEDHFQWLAFSDNLLEEFREKNQSKRGIEVMGSSPISGQNK